LAKKAIDNGFQVIGIQRPIPSYRKEQVTYRLKELNIYDKIKFEITDLTNKNNLVSLLKRFKPIYFAHLASQSSVKKSFEYEELTNESNLVISKNIIDAIEEFSKETIFFFPSSATIFEGYSDTQVNEITRANPKTNYSRTKYKTQEYIQEKVNDSELQLNTGIMFSHESEYRRPNFFSKKITEFLVEYKNKGGIKINVGDLSLERDIGYAEEYVEAIYKILTNNKRTRYIVSSNSLYRLSDFIEHCLDFLEINYKVEINEKNISYLDKRNGFQFISSSKEEYRKYDLKGIRGDNSKILNELGWSPTIKLDGITKRMIDYEYKK
tara:strand:- start:1921 stop:2892 length:972 start_codon:yes stop_codon:yes gene_type:complete